MYKATQDKGIIKKLSETFPRYFLATIYKSFVRRHLDYGDILHYQPNNESFTQNIERIQYSATYAITNAIKKTSQSKLYRELGFGSLKIRHSFRKLCAFFKKENKTADTIENSSLPNRRGARKHGGGNDEPFLISMVPIKL